MFKVNFRTMRLFCVRHADEEIFITKDKQCTLIIMINSSFLFEWILRANGQRAVYFMLTTWLNFSLSFYLQSDGCRFLYQCGQVHMVFARIINDKNVCLLRMRMAPLRSDNIQLSDTNMCKKLLWNQSVSFLLHHFEALTWKNCATNCSCWNLYYCIIHFSTSWSYKVARNEQQNFSFHPFSVV